jgi:hypothetical protein
MSGFSPDWLALREPADHRARHPALLEALSEHLSGREAEVVDLGCGTGSNLRAVAPRLGPVQHWRLVDHDSRLLAAARARLAAWADTAETSGEGLFLTVAGKRLHVSFHEADLARNPAAALGAAPDLVTAAALFDLVSAAWIAGFAAAIAARRALFYTALTYDGVEHWEPPHPADAAMLQAFHAHQASDKGFGLSAGPGASAALTAAFESRGYRVNAGSSPWRLRAEAEAPLIRDLAAGAASAVRETGLVPEPMIDAWLQSRRAATTCTIGHVDLLAVPR